MKKQVKHKNCLFLIAIFIIAFTFLCGATVARYVTIIDLSFNDNGELKDSIDFTVHSVYEVSNQTELFAAIRQGYSYIQISNDLKNPFVITQAPENLTTDLILDLNGIEVYRHGTDPLFVISDGIRLTITDTSDTQRGCLYNPTGSVVKISGGTLTVASGKFECGPRYSEYYSYNNNILSANSHKRTLVNDVSRTVNFTGKSSSISGGQEKRNALITAPIITVYNTSLDGNVHHHGNVYFDWDISRAPAVSHGYENLLIYADTYCYYTTDEDSSYEIMKLQADDADWYYSYYVNKTDFTYYSDSLLPTDDSEDFVEVTIYAYEKTIETAETHDGVKPEDIDAPSNNFYAAIKMTGGVMDIIYGDFYNYFGVNTTACIDMMGGKLTIREGNFSTRIPNSTSHIHNRVDAKEDDAAAFDRLDYFNDFYWNALSREELESLPGTKAHRGEGFCILTSGDAKIEIGNGNFYSNNNNLIHMQAGTLNIGGGNFTKTNTRELSEYQHNDTAIFIHDGSLTINNANYYISGNYSRAIRMIDGKLDISGAHCEVHGDYTYAVYSTIPGNDKLNLTDIDFELYAATDAGRITGIYSAKSESGELGAVNVHTSEGKTSRIFIDAKSSTAIYSDGGRVYSQGCTYEVYGTASSGIYANEGEIEIVSGDIKLDSDIGCYGIYAISKNENKKVTITLKNANVNVGYVSTENAAPPSTVFDDNGGAGTAASIGVFLASANDESYVNLINSNVYSYEIGIALSGGHLTMSDTDTTPNYIKTDRASAIAISGGDLTFSDGGNYSITSFNTCSNDSKNSYNLTIPYLAKSESGYNISSVLYRNTDGIYVSGGTLNAEGTVNITHTGLENETYLGTNHVYKYTSLTITSYAIRVIGGNVNILKGNITALVGGGICCQKMDGAGTTGHITMGREGYTGGTIMVKTDGESYVDGSEGLYNAIGEYISTGWQSQRSITGGHAIELNGGNIEIFYGTYEADFGNGIAAKGDGVITVHSGTFYGWMGKDGKKISGASGPSAFYGLKVIGGATVNIYGGTFNGGNGGAFVTGIDTFNSRSDISGKLANVYVYAGVFGGSSTVDAFNVYDLSNVIFGAHPADKFPGKNAIVMNATSATIAANKITQASVTKEVTIKIYYGDYDDGDKGGVWNDGSFATIVAYNTRSSIDYTDIGGSVTINDNPSPVFYSKTN